MTCGIYCITNLINGKQYVGQSVDIEKRMDDHINSDNDSKIHQAIVKYGVKNFRFEPLIRCSPEELDEQEVKFIRLLGTYENGYNQTRGGQHHVFNIEYNYENYSELKKKVSDKNEIIFNLKQENRNFKMQITKLNQIIEKLEINTSRNEKDLKSKEELANNYGSELVKYRREIMELQNEKEVLYDEKQSLQIENDYLNEIVTSLQQGKLTKEIKTLSIEKKRFKKEIKEFKKEISALNKKIGERDDIIITKNREIQILHERLGWQPINHNNVFEEILEE